MKNKTTTKKDDYFCTVSVEKKHPEVCSKILKTGRNSNGLVGIRIEVNSQLWRIGSRMGRSYLTSLSIDLFIKCRKEHLFCLPSLYCLRNQGVVFYCFSDDVTLMSSLATPEECCTVYVLMSKKMYWGLKLAKWMNLNLSIFPTL